MKRHCYIDCSISACPSVMRADATDSFRRRVMLIPVWIYSFLRSVMQKFPCFDMLIDYESVLDHYNVRNAHELTLKLQSIPSFREILSPMKKSGELWIPDFESRYFTEDVNYGLQTMVEFADKIQETIPTIRGLRDKMREICFHSRTQTRFDF